MSTLDDDATRPSGTDNSTTSAFANGDHSVFPDEGEHLAVFQGYLLPLLYGWIGATAYVVRSFAREARERLYRRENDTAYTLRIFLGSLAVWRSARSSSPRT